MDGPLRPGIQITLLANIIASAIAKNLTPTEENILGNLITVVGTTLTTIAALDEAEITGKESSNANQSGNGNEQATNNNNDSSKS
ncbi:MAG TPA: hypothetical protein VHO66_03055 [Ruminiclostridium sp.]|nr:hypothetical protein [Ruminiclostridium sp.]